MAYTIVLGGGESGLWAAVLAARNGERVLLSDHGTLSEESKALLREYEIPYEEGGHTLSDLDQATQVVKSPGIPDTAPVIQRCLALGLPVISEIEYAYRYIGQSKVIAVTGSNGKTTTTSLITHILRTAGRDAVACGNIGKSLAQCIVRDPHAIYVVELSSFQLDHMYDFRADVAVLTNITPDHLDRYDYSFEKYADAKGRVFRNQTAADTAIYFVDDQITAQMLGRRMAPLTSRVLTFGLHKKDEGVPDAYLSSGEVMTIEADGIRYDIPLTDMPLRGEHNAYNMMASTLATLRMGLTIDDITQALHSFVAVEHRMEPVAVIDGVRYINDSKATNIDSTHYALAAMPDHRTVILLGGTDKGNDYGIIHDLVASKAKALIYLTLDSAKLHKAFDHLDVPTIDAHSMREAFDFIDMLLLEEGDVVLLSPACASFDLFKNYEHRGKVFKEEVARLSDLRR